MVKIVEKKDLEIENDDYVLLNAPMQVVGVADRNEDGAATMVWVVLPMMSTRMNFGNTEWSGVPGSLKLKLPVHLVDKVKLPTQLRELAVMNGPYR